MRLAPTHAPTRRSPILSRDLIARRWTGGSRSLVRLRPRRNECTRRAAVGALILMDGKKSERRQKQDLEIKEERTVVDIPDVEFELSLPVDRVPAVDLRPARDARFDFVPTSLEGVVVSIEFQHLRTRSHQTHLAHQHIEELRQLIEAAQPQQAAERRDPLLVGNTLVPSRLPGRLRHGSELQNREGLSMQSRPQLAEENGSTHCK